MTWFALGISILAVAMTFFFRSKNETMARALKASKKHEAELTQTLAEVIDSDGTVRGQLMLPGKMPTDDAMIKLHEAETSLDTLIDQVEYLRNELKQERENNEGIKTLVEAVNGDSVVQIRLPGKAVTPNKTPCGALCKHMFHVNDKDHCKVGYTGDGNRCHQSREQFLDTNNQCIMFERKEYD